MALEVRLPDLGDAVTHARLTTWLKHEGDRVSRGQPIAELETDKTTVEVEAPADGVIATIHVKEGTDRVPIDAVLASIVVDQPGGVAVPAVPEPVIASPPDPWPMVVTAPHVIESRGSTIAEPLPLAAVSLVSPTKALAVEATGDEPAATPLARRMAFLSGLSLAGAIGTGAGGRITKDDVEARLRPARPASVPAPPIATQAAAAVAITDLYEVQALSPARRVTAERLTRVKQTVPHFYLRIDCAMDHVVRVRQELHARGQDRFPLTAFTIRAAALALQKVPAANSAWVDGAVRIYKSADIAIAVNTPSGLIAPIVRQAERKSLLMIAREVQILADRARDGGLKPEEYSGGTFTISNLGMYGVTSLYPIINPPQSCILGVGALEERPVVRDHALAVGAVMTCTLSADHRAIDGVAGAEFLAAFRQLIEDPWALFL
jgi:pyruvate dehydrogenase E2 component (dihydrolipoamide acetyltransferase)